MVAAQALKVGQQVRLDVTRVGRVEGRFVLSSDTSVTLVQHELPTEVRLADVERLWVRGRATGTGALLGAGVGLLTGALYGLLVGEGVCGIDADCTSAELAAAFGVVFGAGGAALGAGVGFVIPTMVRSVSTPKRASAVSRGRVLGSVLSRPNS